MFQFLKNSGKIILGFFLFVIGLGLIYAGCQYEDSIASGIFKKVDAVIYLICFGTSLFGINMIYTVFSKDKKVAKEKIKPPEENKETTSS